jgi:hypothetical protein
MEQDQWEGGHLQEEVWVFVQYHPQGMHPTQQHIDIQQCMVDHISSQEWEEAVVWGVAVVEEGGK